MNVYATFISFLIDPCRDIGYCKYFVHVVYAFMIPLTVCNIFSFGNQVMNLIVLIIIQFPDHSQYIQLN